MKDATLPIFSPARHACAPSYVKLTKQPITGGAYRPLANDEDSNACALSALSGHHGSKLYTQKSAIHAISDNASVFIPKVDAPHLPKTTDDKSLTKPLRKLRTTVPIQFPRLLKFNSRKLTNILWCRLLKSVSKQQKRYPQQGTQSQKLSTPPATPSAPLSQQ